MYILVSQHSHPAVKKRLKYQKMAKFSIKWDDITFTIELLWINFPWMGQLLSFD